MLMAVFINELCRQMLFKYQDSVGAVSYTHLDVYKRQLLSSLLVLSSLGLHGTLAAVDYDDVLLWICSCYGRTVSSPLRLVPLLVVLSSSVWS